MNTHSRYADARMEILTAHAALCGASRNLANRLMAVSYTHLHTDEILVALSICAATNPAAELALRQLPKLRGCEAHSSVILSQVDETTFRKLGVNLTCEPKYQTKKLYHK